MLDFDDFVIWITLGIILGGRTGYVPVSYTHLNVNFRLYHARDKLFCRFSIGCRLPKPLRKHGEVNLVLEARVLAAADQIGVVGEDRDQRIDPAALALGKIAQHVMLHHILVAGMADADAHPPIVVADMLGDRDVYKRQEEEDADVTDIIGGDIETEEEG